MIIRFAAVKLMLMRGTVNSQQTREKLTFNLLPAGVEIFICIALKYTTFVLRTRRLKKIICVLTLVFRSLSNETAMARTCRIRIKTFK